MFIEAQFSLHQNLYRNRRTKILNIPFFRPLTGKELLARYSFVRVVA